MYQCFVCVILSLKISSGLFQQQQQSHFSLMPLILFTDSESHAGNTLVMTEGEKFVTAEKSLTLLYVLK